MNQGTLAGEAVPEHLQKKYPEARIFQETSNPDILSRRQEQQSLLSLALKNQKPVVIEKAPVEEPAAPVDKGTARVRKGRGKSRTVEILKEPAGSRLDLEDLASGAKIALRALNAGRSEVAWIFELAASEFRYIPPLGAKLRVTFEFSDGLLSDELQYLGACADLQPSGNTVLTLHKF